MSTGDSSKRVPLNRTKSIPPIPAAGNSSASNAKPQDFDATIVGKDETQAIKPKSPDSPHKKEVPTKSSKGRDDEPMPSFSNYEISRKLGQGGMGAVYLAKQINLDRMCALKVMMKEIAKNAQFVQRFHREAKAMARIEHPNLVRCYDVGEEDGVHYLAMELIDGKSMQDWSDTLKIIPVGDAVHVTLMCAEALKQAHSLSMVHRDIKPDNILVTKRGEVKVSDLGLAKNTEEDMSMTQSGTGLGTPHYMAPEQARNAKHVDGRSDIYALGCTLYHFVTGNRPFAANSTLELIMEKEKGKYTPANKINPKVPEKLALIIDKMMMNKPEHRYKTCDEVIQALEGLAIASPSLSFITSSDKVSIKTTTASGVLSKSTVTAAKTMPAALTRNSKDDALVRQQKQIAGKIWYLKIPLEDGKIQSTKMPTEKVLGLIKAGKLTLKTQVADDPKKPFVAISQIPIFDEECRKLFTKLSAEAKGHQLKDKFSKLDQQYQWRKFWQFLESMKSNVVGAVSFIVLLCLIGAVGVGIWNNRADINEYVKTNIGFDPGFGKETTNTPIAADPSKPDPNKPLPPVN